jgi:hypothetical protein
MIRLSEDLKDASHAIVSHKNINALKVDFLFDRAPSFQVSHSVFTLRSTYTYER